MTIKEAIQQMAKDLIKTQTFLAEVISVDKAASTVDVKTVADDLELFDVRLRSVIDDNSGMVMYPKVGSIVLVGLIDNNINSSSVLMFSELEEVTINCELVKYNGGELGGMVKAKVLQQELDKTNAVVNALVQAVTGFTPVAGDGGAALKTFATPLLTGKIVGDYTQIENPKIKH